MPSDSRLAGIPLDHVVAEVTAFPLSSEASLELGLTELAPDLSDLTGRLWRRGEDQLMRAFPSFSLDEVVALRDRVWFCRHAGATVPLHTYVRHVAAQYLESVGTAAVPRLAFEDRLPGAGREAHTAIARRCWIWMVLALPQDLLLAALGGEHGPERIELLSPALARQLGDRGYAETHLHVGAALDFPLLWNAALRSLTLTQVALRHDAFKGPGAGLSEGHDLAPWLVRAALARYTLAAFFARRAPAGGFARFLERDLFINLAPRIGVAGFALLTEAIGDLLSGRMRLPVDTFENLKSLYGELTGTAAMARPFPTCPVAADRSDPISPLLGGRTPLSAEVRLTSRCLHYLDIHRRTTPEYVALARLFWQMVRVRCLFYRHVVQRPMTPGLQWFIRHYDRSKPARREIGIESLLEAAAPPRGIEDGLRSLEIRTTPDASIEDIQDYVRRVGNVAAAWRAQPIGQGWRAPTDAIEVGIVFHFIRNRAGGMDTGLPRAYWGGTHAEPRTSQDEQAGNPSGYRYSRFFCEQRRRADALAWLLVHRPLSLHIVRGIDLCTDEMGVPHWVMVPLVRRIRCAAAAGAWALRRLTGWNADPLRTTVHAGEDFVHLLTGLRLVDQAIEQLELREGDRIGHGLALGVDAREWARRSSRIAMTRETRLFDLVWKWGWYGRYGGGDGTGRRERVLDYELAHLAETIFNEPVSPYSLAKLSQDLTDAQRLVSIGFPEGPPPRNGDPVLRNPRTPLLLRYLTNLSVFEKCHEIVWVDAAAEGEALAGLQSALRQKVGSRGIAVEVNPTSNLMVGDLGDLTAHPLWRLRPPRGPVDAPPVSIAIGSDDPLVFASNLRQEYQLLSDALALAGLSDEEARTWLDRTRLCGLEGRFTRPLNEAALEFPRRVWSRGWESRTVSPWARDNHHLAMSRDWILSLFNTDELPPLPL